jgi:hypothetical protein
MNGTGVQGMEDLATLVPRGGTGSSCSTKGNSGALREIEQARDGLPRFPEARKV